MTATKMTTLNGQKLPINSPTYISCIRTDCLHNMVHMLHVEFTCDFKYLEIGDKGECLFFEDRDKGPDILLKNKK